MRKNKVFLSIVLAFAIGILPLSQDFYMPETTQSSDMVQPFAIGPGIPNLSLDDVYAIYQWGLKNDGELQLTQLRSKFQALDPAFGGTSTESGQVGLPEVVGPGAYESNVIRAASGIDINILPAWDLYRANEHKRPVTVAVIDTGIDYRHPELVNSLWTNASEVPGDGLDNDGNGYIDDIYGWDFYYQTNQTFWGYEDSHGTHAAGTIAAGDGASGIVGITDNQYVKIMSLKALGGSQGTGSTQSVIEAIRYAEANGASICNLSFGTTKYSEDLYQTIANSNMLFVIAAGNGDQAGIGYSIDESPIYPAAFDCGNIISAANLMFDGNLSESSNFGSIGVDIAAPGSYVLSTVPGGQYGFMSGTSMAAPMVTGVAAMLYSYRPDISLADVKTILLQSARTLGGLNGKLVSNGMLDANAALSYQ